jgi:hypothetical protein
MKKSGDSQEKYTALIRHRTTPTVSHLMDVWVQSGLTPYTTKSELLRRGEQLVLEELEADYDLDDRPARSKWKAEIAASEWEDRESYVETCERALATFERMGAGEDMQRLLIQVTQYRKTIPLGAQPHFRVVDSLIRDIDRQIRYTSEVRRVEPFDD